MLSGHRLPCGTLTASLDRAFPVKSQAETACRHKALEASVPPLGTDSKPYEMLRGGNLI